MAETAKGQPHGLATLDADGKIPSGQLPDGVGGFEPGVAVSDVPELTSSDVTGEVADSDFNALRADVTATRTAINALLASLRDAGVIET